MIFTPFFKLFLSFLQLYDFNRSKSSPPISACWHMLCLIINLSILLFYFISQTNTYEGIKKGPTYRKFPKISPSMYKPLQNITPQTSSANNPLLNPPPPSLYLEIALK